MTHNLAKCVSELPPLMFWLGLEIICVLYLDRIENPPLNCSHGQADQEFALRTGKLIQLTGPKAWNLIVHRVWPEPGMINRSFPERIASIFF